MVVNEDEKDDITGEVQSALLECYIVQLSQLASRVIYLLLGQGIYQLCNSCTEFFFNFFYSKPLLRLLHKAFVFEVFVEKDI